MTHIEPLEQIEVAQHLGTFESNSPEWHALRSQGVGGSLVGTIAGLNKWESAYTAWAKYTGKIELIEVEVADSPAQGPQQWPVVVVSIQAVLLELPEEALHLQVPLKVETQVVPALKLAQLETAEK